MIATVHVHARRQRCELRISSLMDWDPQHSEDRISFLRAPGVIVGNSLTYVFEDH